MVLILKCFAAIAMLVSSADNMSTYSSFQEARETGNKVKIAGQLSKDKELHYEPQVDPNYFTFYIKDTKGEEHKVVLHGAKPQDFEQSEQIVVTGRMKGDEFIASDLLMKCPSKYKDEEVYIKSTKES